VKQVISQKIVLFGLNILTYLPSKLSLREWILSAERRAKEGPPSARKPTAYYKTTQDIMDGFMPRADSNSPPEHVHNVNVCKFHNYTECRNIGGHAIAQFLEALCYKQEGRGFDSQ
jgi:hypothetical protein